MSAIYRTIDEGLREELQQAVGRHRYRLWFRDTAVTYLAEEQITLAVPTEVHRAWLEYTYGSLLQETCDRLLGEGVRVELQVCDRQQKKRLLRDQLPTRPDGWQRLLERHRPDPQLPDFVVGRSGRFPVMLLEQLLKGGGAAAASPIYLYGPAASGKTFLMDALGAELSRRSPGSTLQMTCKQFTQRYVGALRRKEIDALRAFRLDLSHRRWILLDGFDELAQRPSTQGELARLHDATQGTDARIVMAGRSHPRDLEGLSPRLRSRLLGGVVVGLALPDGAVLDELLEKRAASMGMPLPLDVREEIQARTSSIRGAVALAERWAAASAEVGEALGVSWLTELAPGAAATASEEVVRRAKDLVADHYSVDRELFDRPSKVRSLALPRRVAMYLVYRACAMTLGELAEAFGLRSHSSVSRAIQELRAMREVNPALEQTIDGLLARL
ncbi:MAG: AAA family ATPase [bacterium]|nr:AAA family ATPase [bacterium]